MSQNTKNKEGKVITLADNYNPAFDFSSLYNENVNELRLMFQDCYGVYDGDKLIRVLDFMNIGDKRCIRFLVIDHEKGSYESSAHLDEKVNLNLPKLGFINTKNAVIHTTRSHVMSSPTRYRKGLRADKITAYNISFKEIADIRRNLNEMSDFHRNQVLSSNSNAGPRIMNNMFFETFAKDLFFPKYYDWKEALDTLINLEKLSCAINRTIAVKIDKTANQILLCKNQFYIGYWSFRTNRFIMRANTFNKELDALKIPYKAASV